MQVCLKPKPSDLLVIDVFVHVIILLAILFIFFLFIISPLERKELNGQIKSQIDEHMLSFYEELNTEMSKTAPSPGLFKTFVDKLNETPEGGKSTLEIMDEYYDKPDQATTNWNKLPTYGTSIVLLSLILGFVAIWLTLKISCKKCIPLGRIILENVVLFGLIGCIEAAFFYFIAMNYVPVLPSYFVDETLNSLKKRFIEESSPSQ